MAKTNSADLAQTSSLIRVFPVCNFDKNFAASSLYNHFFVYLRIQKVKCLKFMNMALKCNVDTRTQLLSKLFIVLVIGVVFLVTLHVFIRHENVEFPQSLFHMEDKRAYAQSINPGTIRVESDVTDITSGKFNNRWIVLLTVNYGFYDMFQNWLLYFQSHRLNLTHTGKCIRRFGGITRITGTS